MVAVCKQQKIAQPQYYSIPLFIIVVGRLERESDLTVVRLGDLVLRCRFHRLDCRQKRLQFNIIYVTSQYNFTEQTAFIKVL